MSTYRITTYLAPASFIEISKLEFNQIYQARLNLGVFQIIEERFDFLLENYTEFEKVLLDITLHTLVFGAGGFSNLERINRRLANLLSSARVYTDQVKHLAKQFESLEINLADILKKGFMNAYDTRLGYRVMESLRNYIQHRGFAVQALGYNQRKENKYGTDNLVFQIFPCLLLEELQGQKLRTSVLSELEAIGRIVPITPLLREYIEGLSFVHEIFRKGTQRGVDSCITLLKSVAERASKELTEKKGGLLVTSKDANGKTIKDLLINEDWLDEIRELSRKNPAPVELSTRYVSGECSLEDDFLKPPSKRSNPS